MAAGLGAAALGALRAARRAGGDLEQAVLAMHETVRLLDHPDFFVTALVARWRAATGTLRWVNSGHPPAYVVGGDGDLRELEGPVGPALGQGEAAPHVRVGERRFSSGERLVLVTDGVIERRVQGGGRLGVDGLRAAVDRAEHPTAALTALAIQEAVRNSWEEPLEDDATVVVLALV
jgi:serine phosphatase RsbU (regulator of sigma subunit)